MISKNTFSSVNEIANSYPDIRIKKINGLTFEKSKESILSYREQLQNKGYLYFSSYLSEKLVKKAADVVDGYLLQNGYMDWDIEGKLVRKVDEGVLLSGYREVSHHKNFLGLVQSKELSQLMDCLFGETSATLDTKWIRVLGPKEATDTHSDYYRFKKLGLPLYTCWIPLVNQGMKEGTLALCEDSCKLDYETEVIPNEELPVGFGDTIGNSCWVHGDYKVGDVVVFNIKTIHASFRNDSTEFRKNCDTRWMPKSKMASI